MAAFLPARFYQGQPGTGDGLLFTFEDDHGGILKEVVVCNTTGSAATLSLAIVPNVATPPATSTVRLLDAYSVNGHDTKVFSFSTVLQAQDQIYGFQGTNDALVVTVSGIRL